MYIREAVFYYPAVKASGSGLLRNEIENLAGYGLQESDLILIKNSAKLLAKVEYFGMGVKSIVEKTYKAITRKKCKGISLNLESREPLWVLGLVSFTPA